MEKLRIAMLISSSGTTAEAILKACNRGRLKRVAPALVIASRPTEGIQKVLAQGISSDNVIVLRPKDYDDSHAFGEAIIKACKARGVDFIGQYGWMVKTPPSVIEAYQGMMVNQHPGPLDPGRPDFGGQGMFGLRVHYTRLFFTRASGRDHWTEATAQRVAVEYDEGTLIKTRRMGILREDDAFSLKKRLLPEEHELQIEVIEDFAEGRVKEFVRESPLVLPSEEGILMRAKQIAKQLF